MVLAAMATPDASAQLSLGLRDTRYVNVAYTFASSWTARFEQSVYSEKPKYQYFRLYFGYSRNVGPVRLSATPFYGMTYGNTYRNCGIDIAAGITPLRWLELDAAVMPLYDSGLKYTTCYSARAAFNCSKAIAIVGTFTNKPEYREAERRVRAGVRFRTGALWVLPEASIATEGNTKNLRMLVSIDRKSVV